MWLRRGPDMGYKASESVTPTVDQQQQPDTVPLGFYTTALLSFNLFQPNSVVSAKPVVVTADFGRHVRARSQTQAQRTRKPNQNP